MTRTTMTRIPMSDLPNHTARRLLVSATAALALGLSACTGATYVPTPTTSAPPSTTATAAPTTSTTAAPPVTCTNATTSYDALAALPNAAGDQGRLGDIARRGYLIAGVSADTLLLGSRNPLTGQLEGFDIDVVRELARAIFGDPSKVKFTVITASQRIPVLQSRTVDVVARNMTMTCARWQDIAFSTEYYHSGQKVLVRKGSTAKTLADLAGQRVCAPNGTSSMAKLKESTSVTAVGSDTHTGCLVLFQQGKVDAITGDDTVLAGLVAQDPYAEVTASDPITAEPYGLGFHKDDKALVQYANTVLAQMRADGRWTAIYNRWLAPSLGPAPAPPTPIYGRA